MNRPPALPSEEDLRWAMQAALEEFSSPALLVDSKGLVALTNATAQGLLSRADDSQAAQALASAVRGEPNPLGLAIRAGPGGPSGLYLVVAREEGDPRVRRAASAAARWSLTRRQSQVLAELIQGRGNKDIAERLTCSPKTVELHVSAILAAAGVGSRAELLSQLLRDG